MRPTAVYKVLVLLFSVFTLSCPRAAVKEKPLPRALPAHPVPSAPPVEVVVGLPVSILRSYAEILKNIAGDSWYYPSREDIIAIHNCILSRALNPHRIAKEDVPESYLEIPGCFSQDRYLRYFPPRDSGADLLSSLSAPQKERFKASVIEGGVGYIRFGDFEFTLKEEFEAVLADFEEQGINKLLLDLRANPGGFMRISVDFLREFAPENTLILRTEYRSADAAQSRSIYADQAGRFTHWKIAVLVDVKTASAAEIVAGTLQLWGARLFGTPTYGKGGIGKEITLPDRGTLLLTTGRYFLANGFSPEGKGIEPDEVIESGEEQYERALAYLNRK